MPLYMDRHDIPDEISAEQIANMHREDIKIQHMFDCRALTYWYDENRNTAFCLIDAPGPDNIRKMHDHAHGQVPHEIILVDPAVVETFLGRIEDPENENESGLNIITDPAFRVMMAVRLNAFVADKGNEFINFCIDLSEGYQGRVVKKYHNGVLLSFKSVSNAINYALDLSHKKQSLPDTYPNIGLSAGLPVAGADSLFENTIRQAERWCYFADHKILISAEVNDMWMNENIHSQAVEDHLASFSPQDEDFLNRLMAFTETKWHDHDLRVNDFNRPLGLSKSQLYRRMVELTGTSPATFLKEFRLRKALSLISKGDLNVSEVAYSAGFNSLSYFSKCFRKRFGCSPTDCIAA